MMQEKIVDSFFLISGYSSMQCLCILGLNGTSFTYVTVGVCCEKILIYGCSSLFSFGFNSIWYLWAGTRDRALGLYIIFSAMNAEEVSV